MGDVLKYGDRVHLENGFDNWQGGFLDSCNASTQGGKYDVSTANTATRAAGTGTWMITSATGKKTGEEVLSNDIVYLQNLYGGDGGYLDVAGNAPASPSVYMVHTFAKKDRDANGTSRWQIIAKTSTPGDGKVRVGDPIHLQNCSQLMAGGFLDTSGSEAGNKLNVSTSIYSDRDRGSGTWRFAKVVPNDVLKYGDKVHLQNGYNNWQGGYLDTCNAAGLGAKYEVSTSATPTRAAGTGTWVILSATGKKIGDEVLAQDRIFLQNQYGGDGGYLDILGTATPTPCVYNVLTYGKTDRDANGTSQWRVITQNSFPADGKVRENDVFHLQNAYNNSSGGFLDTYGDQAGNLHGVVTSSYWDRAGVGTASWRFIKAK